MFIEITTPSNPLRIENFLRPYKRGERPFTPEVAHQVLQMTNHPRNIKDTLQLITEQKDQAQYKEIVLSVFDHREQSADIIILGKKLAIANDFEDKLNNIISANNTNDGVIYASASNQIACYVCADMYPDVSNFPSDTPIFCTADEINLSKMDFVAVKSLKFKEGSEVRLSQCTNLPSDFDVSMCNKVTLTSSSFASIKSLKFKEESAIYIENCYDFPENIDFSVCSVVSINEAAGLPLDFNALKFKEGSKVFLCGYINYPADFDVSMCSEVGLYKANLSSVKSLKFKEGSEVRLSQCINLPSNFDMSMCSDVDLYETDFAPVKSLKFKEGAAVYLSNCKNLPENLDVSMCSKVELFLTNLATVKSMKFKEGSDVNIQGCSNFPERLDFSACDRINVINNNFSTVKFIKLRDEEQMEDSSLSMDKDWKGKIIYADEEQVNQTIAFAKQHFGR